MYWYRIVGSRAGFYYPQWKHGSGDWHTYSEGDRHSWEEAYAVLEKHATPAALAVRFVGTF